MSTFIKSALAAAAVVFAALTLTIIAPVVHSDPAEAGILKKGKIALKVVGRGAGKLEKASRKWGKAGKVIGKAARGVRRGTHKAGRGISKAQRAVRRQVNKHCRGKCAKVLNGARKVGKFAKRLERQVEEKCQRFGQNSRACQIAKDALNFASPI